MLRHYQHHVRLAQLATVAQRIKGPRYAPLMVHLAISTAQTQVSQH